MVNLLAKAVLANRFSHFLYHCRLQNFVTDRSSIDLRPPA